MDRQNRTDAGRSILARLRDASTGRARQQLVPVPPVHIASVVSHRRMKPPHFVDGSSTRSPGGSIRLDVCFVLLLGPCPGRLLRPAEPRRRLLQDQPDGSVRIMHFSLTVRTTSSVLPASRCPATPTDVWLERSCGRADQPRISMRCRWRVEAPSLPLRSSRRRRLYDPPMRGLQRPTPCFSRIRGLTAGSSPSLRLQVPAAPATDFALRVWSASESDDSSMPTRARLAFRRAWIPRSADWPRLEPRVLVLRHGTRGRPQFTSARVRMTARPRKGSTHRAP
jgi:hypothetical protein